MESILEVLHNFYLVCQWHRKPFDEESYDLDLLHNTNVMENEEEEIGKENTKDLSAFAMEDKEGVSGTTLLMVRRQLRVSRRVGMYNPSHCSLFGSILRDLSMTSLIVVNSITVIPISLSRS